VFEPNTRCELDVTVEFAGLGVQRARWSGEPAEFRANIAPARTFGFAREAELLRRSGRAAHVDLDAVLVFDDRGQPLNGACPPKSNELARHKLLDLLGDSYLWGGPVRGTIRATRPGHRANHEVFRTAIETGLLTPTNPTHRPRLPRT
jgi:UDP-3-O-[3-hydroxymyristoyl] N-acetylglucosamine deacetylase